MHAGPAKELRVRKQVAELPEYINVGCAGDI